MKRSFLALLLILIIHSASKAGNYSDTSSVLGRWDITVNISGKDFPSSTYITLIKRNDQYIQPTGADRLIAGDRLLVLSGNEEDLQEVLDMLSEK